MHEAVARVFAGAADAALTLDQRTEIARRQGGKCFGCGEPLTARRVHGHFIPRSKGGPHGMANRVAICLPCENGRGDRMPSASEAQTQANFCAAVSF